MSLLPVLPTLDLATPETCALDSFKLSTAAYIAKTLEIPLAQAYAGIESGRPGKGEQGDFMVAVPRYRIKGDAKALAQKLASELVPDAYLASASAQGQFVSFTLNTHTVTRLVLEQINELTHLSPAALAPPPVEALNLDGTLGPKVVRFEKGSYGSNTAGAGKKAVVEFSSPNLGKPFHAGHLRSTIIGAFLANLYEANGWECTRMNYLGDWGKQFGLLAVGFERYGSAEQLESNAISHLYEIYVKINADAETDETVHDQAREFFKAMEDGDETSLALWRKFRELSITKYRETYARLNIHFDVYSGESTVSRDAQEAALKSLLASGHVEESNGALVVDLTAFKLAKTVVRKKDGTYVYITRDIAGAAERWEQYGFDKMIYVVATQQDLHMAQFFKVLDLMGFEWQKRLEHINFGMVLGMSTRKGTAVFLDQILNESRDVMHEQMKSNEAKYALVDDPETVSDKLGITAVKIQDMSAKRIGNYKFEWSRMTSFEGDTGPYLQYAHVRLSSVERRNAPDVVLPAPHLRASTIDTTLLSEPKARDIVILLASYPDVIKVALKVLEPSTIVTFCFRLTHAISSAWEVLIVKGQPQDVAMARLWLYVCARDVLANAMRLLTLEPLQKM